MANKYFLFTLCFFMLGFTSPSKAARFSGQYLINMCAMDQTGKELVEGGHVACQSYIAGVLDYHNLIKSLGTAPSVNFCVPETATMNELQSQVLSYLIRNKKDHEKFVAAPGVALALFERYPCPGTKVRKGKPK